MFERKIELGQGWGVLHVDPQRDFLPGGALAVKDGNNVIKPLNRITEIARRHHVPVAMSADWHPADTIHFQEQGGPWPVHCVENTPGAAFGPGIDAGDGVTVFHKGMSNANNGYSPFEGRSVTTGEGLNGYFRRLGVDKLLVDGLATDYCVKEGVLDALHNGYQVFVVKDAIAAVNVHTGDGKKALDEMKAAGAQIISSRRITG